MKWFSNNIFVDNDLSAKCVAEILIKCSWEEIYS